VGLSGLAAGEGAIIATGELLATKPILIKNAVEFAVGYSDVPVPPVFTPSEFAGMVTRGVVEVGKDILKDLDQSDEKAFNIDSDLNSLQNSQFTPIKEADINISEIKNSSNNDSMKRKQDKPN
jgi:hypothetical protein